MCFKSESLSLQIVPYITPLLSSPPKNNPMCSLFFNLCMQILKALSHSDCKPPRGSIPHCLEAVHITDASFPDVVDTFLSNDNPLGFLGIGLKQLSFSGATLGEPAERCYETLSESVSRGTQRWVFFRAVRKLKCLQVLEVEPAFWTELTCRNGRCMPRSATSTPAACIT